MTWAVEADAELVTRARGGDRDAFGALVLRHRRMVHAVCQQLLGDPALADDALQEALLQAYLDLDRLRARDRFGAWLAGIALNVSRRWLRARARVGDGLSLDSLTGGRQVVGSVGVPDPSDVAIERDLTRQVRLAVQQLPDGQRAAVALFYLGGLSHAEAALALGIPTGAVKTRLHKARAHLRRSLLHLWEDSMSTSTETADAPAYIDVELTDVWRVLPHEQYTLARNVLRLQEMGGEQRVLGIWVGPFESEAILILMSGAQTHRPMTYAFAAQLLQAAGASVREVRISRLEAETYFAETVLTGSDGVQRVVDSRPSDAVALALVAGAPIRVSEVIMREASVPPDRVPLPDGTRVLTKAAIIAEMERVRAQREAETELVNAEIRARRQSTP